ncbi:MAG: hypothetical protein H0W14_06755, partial [Actinobacteria bacterium]|nr:hypothetical protein [Actinomycetota bacterium]
KTGSPIGSGPFLVGSWERGKQLTLVRNRRYWGPHTSYLDRIVVRFRRTTRGTAPPAEVLEAVRQGGIDFVFSRDTSVVPELRRLPGFRVFPAAAGGREYLQIRIGPGGHPALRDKRVRRALAYGIDRADIVRRLFGELDPRYPPSDSAIFQPSHQSYRPNWDAYRYRPAESRRLLAQAGCHLGTDDIYVCGGKKLELRLVTTAGGCCGSAMSGSSRLSCGKPGFKWCSASPPARRFSVSSSPAATSTSPPSRSSMTPIRSDSRTALAAAAR